MRRCIEGTLQQAGRPPNSNITLTPGELAIIVAIIWVIGCVLWPTLPNHRVPPAYSHMKQAALATLMYAQDYDEHFPLSREWYRAIDPYLGRNHDLALYSPTPDVRLSEQEVPLKDRRSIAMNNLVAGDVGTRDVGVGKERTTVLLAETHYRYHQDWPWSPRKDFWTPGTLMAPDRGTDDKAMGWKQLGKPGAVRWNGGAFYAFIDGHVKSYRPEEVHPTGYLSDDDEPSFGQ